MKFLAHTILGLLILLSPSIAKAQTDMTAQLGKILRMQFMMIAGFPSDEIYTEITGGDGPPKEGLINFVNALASSETGFGVLIKKDYSSCDAIPASGTSEGTVEDTVKVATGVELKLENVTITYGEPVKSPPAGWTNAGTKYEKQVLVEMNGKKLMKYEFNCNDKTGWVALAFPESGDIYRNIEMYFQADAPATTKVAFYMYYPSSEDERMAMLFHGEADGKFKYWMTRTAKSTEEGTAAYEGVRKTVHGDATNKKASGFLWRHRATSLTTSDSIAAVTDADGTTNKDTASPTSQSDTSEISLCVDWSGSSTTATAGQLCSGLALEEQTGNTVIDSDGKYTVQWTAKDANLKNKITILN